MTGLTMQTVFRKIDFIHQQCQRFAGDRERQLTERDLDTRYICVDRQNHIVNWSSRKDRRNVALLAIGSADLESGYVFGMHLNFDGELDPEFVAEDIRQKQSPLDKHEGLQIIPNGYSVNTLSDRLAMWALCHFRSAPNRANDPGQACQ